MTTATLHVELPMNLSEQEARLLLAIKLFETGRATLGQSARTAGYSKRAFIDLLGQHGIPVINYDADELRAEMGT